MESLGLHAKVSAVVVMGKSLHSHRFRAIFYRGLPAFMLRHAEVGRLHISLHMLRCDT